MRKAYLILAYNPFSNAWSIPVVDIKSLKLAEVISAAWIYERVVQDTDPFWVAEQREQAGVAPLLHSDERIGPRAQIRWHVCSYKRGAVTAGLTPKWMYLLSPYQASNPAEDVFCEAFRFTPVQEITDDGCSVLTFNEDDLSTCKLLDPSEIGKALHDWMIAGAGGLDASRHFLS